MRDGVADVSEKADTHGTVPVKVKYPKMPGETTIDRNKRIRILRKKALDPEQLKEHKRKNLVWLHKHREKNKKIRYPHLKTRKDRRDQKTKIRPKDRRDRDRLRSSQLQSRQPSCRSFQKDSCEG